VTICTERTATYYVECDWCGAFSSGGTTKMAARLSAQTAGWRETRRETGWGGSIKQDICPDCQERFGPDGEGQ